MAGIALALDLLRKSPTSYNTIHSSSRFTAAAAAASVAAVTTPYAYKSLFGNVRIPIVESVAEPDKDPRRGQIGSLFENDCLLKYKIELKPLFSGFEFKLLAMTSLRSFLVFCLPVLCLAVLATDEDEFLEKTQGVNPFKMSLKRICRETSIVTTRRFLERMVVKHFSPRMSWKLLKDVPKSATRKVSRGMSSFDLFRRVSKTTLRGHVVGVVAIWSVQVWIEFCRFTTHLMNMKEEESEDEVKSVGKQIKVLGKKLCSTTIKCSSSLVFASIGSGIGAVLFRPSAGQWICCWAGDLGGPVIVSICIEKVFGIEI